MKKIYYVIQVSENEFINSYKRICETLQEAESHVMEYTDWYCPRGTCHILKVDEEFNVLERRWYKEGKYVPDAIHIWYK